MAPPRLDAGYLADAFIASDPDGSRLRGAIRATSSAALAAMLLSSLPRLLEGDVRAALVGVVVAANGSVLPTDTLASARRTTAILIPFVAIVLFSLGTLAPSAPAVRVLLLPIVVFFAVFARRFGPRGTALGTMGFLGYFFSQFLATSLERLPAMCAGMAISGALALGIRFATPERPAAVLARAAKAVRLSAACVLHTGARALAGAGPLARVEADLARLNESALAVEDAVVLVDGQASALVRASVFASELAANRFYAAVEIVLEGAPLAGIGDVLRAVDDARRAVRERDPAAAERARATLEAAAEVDPAVARLRRVVSDLLDACADPPVLVARGLPATRVDDVVSPPATVPVGLLVQAPLSTLVAMLLGNAVASGRGYWAVIAAYVVFTRAATLGLAALRARQRVVGTLLGLGIGLVSAEVLHGHRNLELAAIFACLFVAYYFMRQSYAVFVGAFSLLLAVLYGFMGQLTSGLLVLRVVETLVGAASALVIATVVMPARPQREISRRAAAVLRALADHVTCSVEEGAATSSMRMLDRKLRLLREVAEGVTTMRLFGMAPELGRSLGAISAAVFCARPLAETAVGLGKVPRLANVVVARARRLAEEIERRAEVGPVPELVTEPIEEEIAPAPSLRRTIYWLGRTNEALALLERPLRRRDAP